MGEAIGRRLTSLARELRLLREFDVLQRDDVGTIFADARAARARRGSEIVAEIDAIHLACLEWTRTAQAGARTGAPLGVLASADVLRVLNGTPGGRRVPAG